MSKISIIYFFRRANLIAKHNSSLVLVWDHQAKLSCLPSLVDLVYQAQKSVIIAAVATAAPARAVEERATNLMVVEAALYGTVVQVALAPSARTPVLEAVQPAILVESVSAYLLPLMSS